MKKITKLLIILFVLICLSACSKGKESSTKENNEKNNELATLYDNGYELTMTTLSDNKWLALYQKDYSYKDAYKVEINMDKKTYDELMEIDTFDEEGNKRYIEILESLPDCTITSMNDQIPNNDEFDKYIGKTIQELENDGYIRNGYVYNDDGCVFDVEGPKYCLDVQVDEVITFETMDNYSENDIRKLTIKKIDFKGFSFGLFD